MKLSRTHLITIFIVCGIVLLASCLGFHRDHIVDFSAEVKPIFNSKCITCHGGVKAKSGFSLLFREEAMAKAESGKRAIVPGHPEQSEMIRRIKNRDPEERMPYKHQPLSTKEVETLEAWIKQGAKWGDHWAYLPVKSISVPEVDSKKVYNNIDNFIVDRLEQEKMSQSAEAPKAVLLRRVSLDLTGVLPDEKLAKQYLSDNSPNAYQTLVDSLLASKRFGERWAAIWLDIARYADTKGYEADKGRNIWKYRDWVIDAFNADKPYNQFITEQIAGDLLPDPTDAQYIATAFHRNSMTNDEGGTDNEEFRTAAVLDRVNTTWESLMGTTFGCVQCHSHPYDPFRHEEYYKFMAYFNNSRDEDTQNDYPLLRDFNDTAKRQIAMLTAFVEAHGSEQQAKDVNVLLRTLQPVQYSGDVDSLKNAFIEGNNGPLIFWDNALVGYQKIDMENVGQVIYNYNSGSSTGVMEIHLDRPDGPLLTRVPVKSTNDWRNDIAEFKPQSGVHDVYILYTNSTPPKNREKARMHADWFAFTPQLPGKGSADYAEKKKLFERLLIEQTDGTPVMVENNAFLYRTSNVFDRGNWRAKGAVVRADVPAVLKYAMPKNAPPNRMGLAMWLTSKNNPLVSRTLVNRFWEQLFGKGIAETLEDMGTQGIPPTHRELLNYLSYEFMNKMNWSMKSLLREMVMSRTYRQDSKTNAELTEKDPLNKFYARGPRVRLSAEQIRDQDLCISGMLSTNMYGPGVMPWQPDGIWVSPYNSAKWKTDSGENHYRRAVYTYWKRSSPYPSMIAFDAAQKNVCSARRIRTNTPLQALVTLNDSVYVDLARHFAKRMQKEGGSTATQQVSRGYELMLFKTIPPEKLQVLMALFEKARGTFVKDPAAMKALAGKVQSKPTPESTAMIVVANAMLNLDEVVMKN